MDTILINRKREVLESIRREIESLREAEMLLVDEIEIDMRVERVKQSQEDCDCFFSECFGKRQVLEWERPGVAAKGPDTTSGVGEPKAEPVGAALM